MDVCGRECILKNLGLDHPDPRVFVESQGGGGSLVYLVYRVAVALFFGFVLVYSGVVYEYGAKWLIFLTYWTLFVLTLNVVIQAILVLGRHPSRRKPATQGGDACTKKMPVVLKIVWVLQNVTLSSALVVTLVYWIAVYDGWKLNIVNVSAHALNSVYVICDVCVTGIPVRMLHFYHTFLFGVFYAIFSISYWAAGGTNHEDKVYIYSVMDYQNHPTTAAVWLLVLFVSSIILHFVMYGMYTLRVYLYSRCAPARVEPPLPEVETPAEISVTKL